MLIIIGLLLIYIDIVIGAIDVIPDCIGYALLLLGLLTEYRRLQIPGKLLFLALGTFILSILGLINTGYVVLKWSLYGALVVLEAVTVHCLLKELSRSFDGSDPVWPPRVSLTNTCIVFVAICSTAGLPLSLFTAGAVLIALCKLTGGLYITYIIYKLYRIRQSQY